MKILKTSFAIIAMIAAVSLSSCTVEYRARHHREGGPERHDGDRHNGMVKPVNQITLPVA